MRRLSLVVLLLLAIAVPVYADESLAEYETANRLLRAELELARTKQLYFICDLKERHLRFKTAGITLAELPISGLRIWGRLPASQMRTVAAKTAPFSPRREKVGQIAEEKKEVEKKEEGKPFEIKALEIGDMPTFFTIIFNDGLRIVVRPVSEGGLSRLQEKSHLFFWFLSRPLISDWNFFQGKAYTELHLTMPAKDVQLLYWSLAESSPFLLDMPPPN
jgi:hypothetical protein